MFGSVLSAARAVAQIVFALSVLVSAEAQAQSIVGTWTAQGSDWVWNFQANAQFVVTGTGATPSAAPYCASIGSMHGTYTASAGVFSFSTDSSTCNGVNVPGPGDSGTGRYAFTGNALTLSVVQTAGQNVGAAFSYTLNSQSGNEPPPPITPTTPLPLPPTTQSVFAVPTGTMPTAAVSVTPSGTFGNATLAVTLDLSTVLSGGSFAGPGQFASGYNIYVAALAPQGALGLPNATWFVFPATYNWTLLSFPIAAYMTGLAQNATNSVVITVLQGTDVTALVGTELYVGYGTSDTEMLSASRYRGVYKVQ